MFLSCLLPKQLFTVQRLFESRGANVLKKRSKKYNLSFEKVNDRKFQKNKFEVIVKLCRNIPK